jgi:hypothetical protein
MDESYKEFGATLARAVIARDFAAVRELLAPWLRSAMAPAAVAEAVGLGDEATAIAPEYSVESNRRRYEQLKEPDGVPPRSHAFDPGLTADNFRQWMCVEFRPSDDSDEVPFDLWMALVEVDGRLAVGYFERTEAD